MVDIKENKAIIKIRDMITPDMAKEIDDILTMLKYDEYKNIEIVELNINSPGGSVIALFSIIDSLNGCDKKIQTFNAGMCASAASMLFLYPSIENRYAMQYAMLMIHRVQGGNKEARDKYDEAIELLLAPNFPNKTELGEMLDTETYMSCEDMKKHNLIYGANMINSKHQLDLSPINQTVEEMVNIYNKIDENNMKTEKKETVEIVDKEEIRNEIKAEISNEFTNKIDALKAEITNKSTELEALKSEKEEIANKLKTYVDAEVKDEKEELLKAANISNESYDTWLKLDVSTIKELTNTLKVEKKSPNSEEKEEIIITNKGWNDYTPKERQELHNTDIDAYMHIFNNRNK